MTDYTKLVEALRCCATCDCDSEKCKYIGLGMDEEVSCIMAITKDAAAAIEALQAELEKKRTADCWGCKCEKLEPKRCEWILTNDEIETIRIHMNAIKEQLCNQHRHREAEAYQTIVDKLAKMMEVQDGTD